MSQYMSRSEAEAVMSGLTEKEKIALLCLLRSFEKQHGAGKTATGEAAAGEAATGEAAQTTTLHPGE